MASPPDDSPTAHPLEPVLRDAEAELRRRLGEACEAESRGISSESTAEIRRLEDRLLAAAVAAEHTIALRRHIDQLGASPASATAAALVGARRFRVGAVVGRGDQRAGTEGASNESRHVGARGFGQLARGGGCGGLVSEPR